MDTPISPLPSSPAVVPLRGTKEGPVPHPSKTLWVLAGLGILTLGILVGLYGSKLFNPSTNQFTLVPTPSPTPLPAEASAKEGDPTANWKTYVNNKLGFSYQYPSDWELIPSLDLFAVENKKDGTIIQTHLYSVSDLPKGYSSVGIWFNDLRTKNQKSILPNDGFYYGPGSDNPYKWYMSYNMDNFKAVEIDRISAIVTSSINTGLVYIVVPTEKYVYEIIVNPISAYENVTVRQILSTFKFLDTPSPTPPRSYNPHQAKPTAQSSKISATPCLLVGPQP